MAQLREGMPVKYWPEPNDTNIRANGKRTPVDAVIMRVLNNGCANLMLFEEDVEPVGVGFVQRVDHPKPGCFTIND